MSQETGIHPQTAERPVERRSERPVEQGAVVVAVDGSDDAGRALRWASRQASLEGRALVVLAVGPELGALADETARTTGERHPGLVTHPLVRAGDPRQVLVDVSTRAHLLVLGSRGRGPLRSVLLGSVGAAVCRRAACPVVVCRPPGEPGGGVLVGADGTAESRPVIEFAFRQASLRGLDLTVVHSYWDAAAAVAHHRRDLGEAVADPDLDDLRLLLSASVAGFAEQFPDVAVTLKLRHGLVDDALSPRGVPRDLVVVGRHPVGTLERVVGGAIALAVLEHSRCTVAVVPQPDA